MQRVAVTGIGAVTPLGNTFRESWEALKAGCSGIGQVTRFDASDLQWNKAGELKGFEALEYISLKDRNRVDLFVGYAAAAARMAFDDSGIRDFSGATGVVLGSSRGGLGTVEACLRKRATAFLMPGTTVSAAASHVAGMLGIKGHILGVSNACASGSSAIGEAFRLIKHGLADTVISGGAEAPVCRICMEGYGAMGALSMAGISRPFDSARDGFVLAEGACVLVLEDYEKAVKRGARIYGEILGYGNSAESFHQTAPARNGQVRAMEEALDESGLGVRDISYVSAHATSTPLGDSVEAGAISDLFGDRKVFVSAVKSMTGHMLGASGALEAGFTLMSLREGIVPPTINMSEPEFKIGCLEKAHTAELRYAVSNSFGFGGLNTVLVFC